MPNIEVITVPGHAHPVQSAKWPQLARQFPEKVEDWAWGNWLFVGCFKHEGALLAEHIRAAVDRACPRNAYVVSSGGPMRQEFVGDLTEAEAYRDYAVEELGLDPSYPYLRLEMAARDSGENIFDTVGLMMDEPEIKADPSMLLRLRLTVCGWGFKETRYRLQAAALRVWLMAKGVLLAHDWFDYIGVNNPSTIPQGEAVLVKRLEQDLFLLGEEAKRKSRADHRAAYSALGCLLPDLVDLSSRAMRQ